MARLRGHHLICLHFFKPEALGEAFASKARHVLSRLESGEPIIVVDDADEVCSACPYLRGDECAYSEGAEEEIKAMDRDALKLLGLEKGAVTTWSYVKEKVSNVIGEWRSKYCSECEWNKSCFGA
ncbi:MAG: DUF1284 domain-containing protein [Thermoprotei archaeon]|nr:MAG: DUF1284 domain-containing protein [Thermoprotei archaeon]